MENTVGDFWKMVEQQKVPAIVMLCGLQENGVVWFMHTQLHFTCKCYIRKHATNIGVQQMVLSLTLGNTL